MSVEDLDLKSKVKYEGGSVYGVCANAVTEISNGVYKIALTASDMTTRTLPALNVDQKD